jgi:hypothetical protein
MAAPEPTERRGTEDIKVVFSMHLITKPDDGLAPGWFLHPGGETAYAGFSVRKDDL